MERAWRFVHCSEDPVAEMQYLQKLADKHGKPSALVAFGNCASDEFPDQLKEYLKLKNIRSAAAFASLRVLISTTQQRHPAAAELAQQRRAAIRGSRRLPERREVAKGVRAAGQARAALRAARLHHAPAEGVARARAALPAHAADFEPHGHADRSRRQEHRRLARGHGAARQAQQRRRENQRPRHGRQQVRELGGCLQLGLGFMLDRCQVDGGQHSAVCAAHHRDLWRRPRDGSSLSVVGSSAQSRLLQFASNFPVDKVLSSYDTLYKAFKTIVAEAEYSQEDQVR